MKVVGLLVATVLALASTSALSLRSDSTVADSGAPDRVSSVDSRGGEATSMPPPGHVAEVVDAESDAVVPGQIATLPPTEETNAASVAGVMPVWANPGTDGPLVVSSNTGWDLGLATTGTWDMDNSANSGKGVYDATKWAVVFKYSSVQIDGSRYLAFSNHPSRAPIVWLVSGNVTINGDLYVTGQDTQGCSAFPEPGPGGYRGGRGRVGSTLGAGGFGPGGGNVDVDVNGNGGGSYANAGTGAGVPVAPIYGNSYMIPLVGGSGGAALPQDGCYGGAGGGGAIMIVCTGTFTLNGNIYAYGGYPNDYAGAGSGGAIRIIANHAQGAGRLQAQGRSGGNRRASGAGRIFVQANVNDLTYPGLPPLVSVDFGQPVIIWPEDVPQPLLDGQGLTGMPSVRPTKLTIVDRTSGQPVERVIPLDPRSSLNTQQTDVGFDTEETATLHVEAQHVPLTWKVEVRIVPKSGDTFSVEAGPLVGTPEASTTTAVLGLPRGIGGIQVRAYKPTP